MTVRELAAALAALPEKIQDLQVFSTADWSVVSGVIPPGEDTLTIEGQPVVEIA